MIKLKTNQCAFLMQIANILAIHFAVIAISQANAQPLNNTCYQAAVSSSQIDATNIGLEILERGGNAVDAAVAVGYALAVVEPCCGNLGGGGFMMIHLEAPQKQTVAINFREKAPATLNPDLFYDSKGKFQATLTRQGYLAVGVPGTVMGLNTALEKYGTLPRKTVMAPAIKLARRGFIIHDTHHVFLDSVSDNFTDDNVKQIFLRNGKPYKMGERLKQKQLANTLMQIAKDGNESFYRGKIAKKIVAASQQHGGVLSLEDFKNYRVSIDQPIVCQYRGYDISAPPPPSAGGVSLCQALNILEKYELACHECPPSLRKHLMIEAMRHSFADRRQYLGDPKFVEIPFRKLLSKEHAESIRQSIQLDKSTPSELVCPQPIASTQESADTTHYSVIDKQGNMVAVTTSLNHFYGAKVIAGDTGFLLNNHMNDFTFPKTRLNNDKNPNRLVGNKRPLSSMTPTFVFKDNKPAYVLGTPGGPTIITTILQVLIGIIDEKLSLEQASNKPRFHMQCQPDTVFIEEAVFDRNISHQLANMGHHLKVGSVYQTRRWGAVAGIAVTHKAQQQCLIPVIDSRRPFGLAKGISQLTRKPKHDQAPSP